MTTTTETTTATTVKVTVKKVEKKETATAVVNGNTVNFDYNYTEGATPEQVNYQAFRGKETDSTFTGQQVLGGSMQKNGAFTSFNIGAREQGDGVTFDGIYTICEAILNGTIIKE